MKLTSHPRVVPLSRMHGAVLPFRHMASWYTRVQLYFTFNDMDVMYDIHRSFSDKLPCFTRHVRLIWKPTALLHTKLHKMIFRILCLFLQEETSLSYWACSCHLFYCPRQVVPPLSFRKTTVKKVKCTLVQALRLCTGRTAHRGNRGIALLFHDQRHESVSVTPRPLFTPRKDPVPIVREAGWAPGPVWRNAEILVPHRDSIPGPSSP